MMASWGLKNLALEPLILKSLRFSVDEKTHFKSRDSRWIAMTVLMLRMAMMYSKPSGLTDAELTWRYMMPVPSTSLPHVAFASTPELSSRMTSFDDSLRAASTSSKET